MPFMIVEPDLSEKCVIVDKYSHTFFVDVVDGIVNFIGKRTLPIMNLTTKSAMFPLVRTIIHRVPDLSRFIQKKTHFWMNQDKSGPYE